MDCTRGISALQSRIDELPPELAQCLSHGSNSQFLATVSAAALSSKFTDTLFTCLAPLFADVCARWILGNNLRSVIPAFGRVLSFAPQLAEYAEAALVKLQAGGGLFGSLLTDSGNAQGLPENETRELLLGIYRLLVFDNANFARFIQPSNMQLLLSHHSRSVRYLAIRVLCLYLHAADAAMEGMVAKYIGEEPVDGVWESRNIDYRFLSLWEEQRYRDIKGRMQVFSHEIEGFSVQGRRIVTQEDLSPLVMEMCGVLLPHLSGRSSSDSESGRLVPTTTTARNLRSIANALLDRRPILLTGPAGSGKTLIVSHLATRLSKIEKMVTLHLNQQSDAKLLVGMYTTGTKPGTFTWRPGVLTTAVREGRWVLIEDLDRAPSDIISTLLPLIERGELLIPGRGEAVRAAHGFKIIATMRTSLNLRGEETAPGTNMLGIRFWQRVHVQMLDNNELAEVTASLHSSLQRYVQTMMAVYARLQILFHQQSFLAESKTGSMRPLTPRDLIKWCSRVSAMLARSTTFTSAELDKIFLEAVDCYAGSLQNGVARDTITACIAEELHVDPQRREHLLVSRGIEYGSVANGKSPGIRVGRIVLPKDTRIATRSKRIVSRPFSTNDHTIRLLERVAVAVDRKEPLLLVGETGIGKTTCVQHLAERTGRKLVAFNLSQQSESSDLVGGFKPVNVRSLVMPLKDEFDEIYGMTFSLKKQKNRDLLPLLGKSMAKGQWDRICKIWSAVLRELETVRLSSGSESPLEPQEAERPKKKQKVAPSLLARWEQFATGVKDLESQLSSKGDTFAFTFVEGNIVKAVRNGDWILLDEINLASPDTLEALADLLGGGPDERLSILLTEAGNVERVRAHPEFRVFAAMNPATDVGKKDLPSGIRSWFTEIYVESPDKDVKSLRNIVETYLAGNSPDRTVASDVTDLYLKIQSFSDSNMLVDGADQKPHFSLRTLTRTLTYARDITSQCGIRRALYEGFHMSFLTFLNKASEALLTPVIWQHLFGRHVNAAAELKKPLRKPDDGRSHVQVGHHWLRQGKYGVDAHPHYIITPFVKRNLDNLVRAASTRRFPVLIQGPTSAGKTSMVEYLANRSGNKFVRINNHEHTDLQEYLGTYVSGSDGKLGFQEGILVKALREGHWIVLDELNLAPTDVLEALNRLLDENRELLIPETQEVVRPHEDFMLFATQNPAGLYGGRKVLSRAFRNRFLELHFDDIPVDELNVILQERTQRPQSWCKRIVQVYKELSILRQENRLFEQKSFATLRDLFRWALRKAETIDELAVDGYMLLAERVRKPEERLAVKEVIERVLSSKGPKVHIDEDKVYDAQHSPEIQLHYSKVQNDAVVWTRAMRRLYVLAARALRNNEPVLLVGETGCGKTTVCQMLADAFGKELHIVNAHQNTETGDLIGAQRPIRNKAAIEEQLHRELVAILGSSSHDVDVRQQGNFALLKAYDKLERMEQNNIPPTTQQTIQTLRTRYLALFEWADGSLVQAMRSGQCFLLDEISLADDSVLERLNSVLEPQRTLLLAEKGPVESFVQASDGFQFFATMNPGGDYGKRELSPALRNRFTEIWVPALSDIDDISQIVRAKLSPSVIKFAAAIVSFARWFNQNYNTSAASAISIRDTLAWVTFINRTEHIGVLAAVVHGAAMVFIDTLGANPAAIVSISTAAVDAERRKCLDELSRLLETDTSPWYFCPLEVVTTPAVFSIGPFFIPVAGESEVDPGFALAAPTTKANAMRVLRALQLSKPILLEGNPGVGKTTLVAAIARIIGKPLARINLSEQTDLMDLFGSDVPAEGAQAGTFVWRDAPFLRAMKNGDWVLLDEMNLASQSVLEGLNACLDHRGEAYISELDQTFHCHSDFRLFAAQNPHHQGGGRKGLPASFVNRFTVVYADIFKSEDLMLICKQGFPTVPDTALRKLIDFVSRLDTDVGQLRRFGTQGGPWEFNLRDVLRWLQLLTDPEYLLPSGRARDFLDVLFTQRFRNSADRMSLETLFVETFKAPLEARSHYHNLSTETFQVGLGLLRRNPELQPIKQLRDCIAHSHLSALEACMVCVQKNWPVILVGAPASGKTGLIQTLAATVGASLVTFSMSADIDATDLVGGYEQVDPSRQVHHFLTSLRQFVHTRLIQGYVSGVSSLRLAPLAELSRIIRHMTATQLDRDTCAEVRTLLAVFVERNDDAHAKMLLVELTALLKRPIAIDRAQFEWVDGLLVQALQQGQWLVLDNANLCSASVLDRLNSLLEPKGYLSVNEHTTEVGEARVVKPHPDFRIFLTMDPRYGELSRAMRNRAVEVSLVSSSQSEPSAATAFSNLSFSESAMYRIKNYCNMPLQSYEPSFSSLVDVISDHLSIRDASFLAQFQKQVSAGLLDLPLDYQSIFSDRIEAVLRIDKTWVDKAQKTYQDISKPVVSSPDYGIVQVSSSPFLVLRGVTDLASVYIAN